MHILFLFIAPFLGWRHAGRRGGGHLGGVQQEQRRHRRSPLHLQARRAARPRTLRRPWQTQIGRFAIR